MIDQKCFIDGVVDKYPEELLDGRVTTEGNLIACLFEDPTLYDDIKQQINIQNFITRDGRFLFGVIKFLREKKFSVIDEVTVLSNCTEEMKDRLVGIGGYKTIQKMSSVVDIKNWDAILDSFNKSNILLRLYSNGFNLFDEVSLVNGKRVKPIDLFSKANCDSNTVLAWYEEFLSKLSVENSSASTKVIDEKYVDFDDDFFTSISSGDAAGVSFADAGEDINGNTISMFPFLSRNILGFARGTTSALAAHSGCGKSTLMLNIILCLLSKGLKGVFISNEMSLQDLKVIIILLITTRYLGYWGVTKKKLKSGDLTDEDRRMLKEGAKYWKEHFAEGLKIVTMSDADPMLNEQIIKKEALRNGIDFFVVDTFKLNIGDSTGAENFWLDLVKDSRMLDSLAKKYDLIGLYTIQLASNSIGSLFLDASALSMSKAIKEVLSNLIMFRKVYPEELEAGGPYDFKPFRSTLQPDGSWKDEPYVLEDPSAVYRVLSLDKTRSGADSGDSGVCYLVKYRGDFGKFSETCKVRPVHKSIKNRSEN